MKTYNMNCEICGKDISFKAYEDDYNTMMSGKKNIPDSMPYLTEDEVYQIITDTCMACIEAEGLEE